MLISLFLSVLLFIHITKCANILGIFPAPGYSQFILGEKLMAELTRRGHNVTVISPYTPVNSYNNYTTVSTEGLLTQLKDVDMFKLENLNFMSSIMGSQNTGLRINEYTLGEKNVQNLLHSNISFDLVILEQFFSEALMGFAKHYKAPLIMFSSIGPTEWNTNMMGNPNLPSYMPLTKTAYTTRMTFIQRLRNSIMFFFDALYKRYIIFPKHDTLMKKYFPNSINLDDVMYNASLMLLNSHYSITDPFPLTTGMIEIGGFHIENATLPEDLKKILDDATAGAIYFSMGTNLKIASLKKGLLEDIINVFSKLKQTVLWKSDQAIPNLPKNILVSQWLPQTAILGHKNLKLFISHGGLLSTTESVHFGVPILGIPIFGDQKMNMAKAVRLGFATSIPYTSLCEKTLYNGIKTMLENSQYTENVKMRSKLYHDRPIKPLDLAMYWIDHVLRNKKGTHLRFAGIELKWYQLYLIDILIVPTLIVTAIVLIVKYFIKRLQHKHSPVIKEKLKAS